MDSIAIVVLVILGALVLLAVGVVFWLIGSYNKLVRKKNSVDEGWAQIHTQERQRLDSIDQLVNTVKGYAGHEKGIFDQFAEARGAFSNALSEGSADKMGEAHQAMDQAMVNISAVSEAYPELKAGENFAQLQGEISSLERKIASARRYYNGSVREFNELRQSFPTNIIAGLAGFKEDREYFELDEKEARQAPNISFKDEQ